MEDKKYLIIDRNKCIGCGSCVAATEGKCYFIDGKAWAKKEKIDNPEEIVSICPVDAITATDEEKEYLNQEAQYDLSNQEE